MWLVISLLTQQYVGEHNTSLTPLWVVLLGVCVCVRACVCDDIWQQYSFQTFQVFYFEVRKEESFLKTQIKIKCCK